MGLTAWDEVVIAEELASGCSGIVAPIETNSVAIATILQCGEPSLIERSLKPMTEDFSLAGVAFGLYCEELPQCLTAEKRGEEFFLQGELSVANATIGNWFVVPARLQGELTLFRVPAKSSGLLIKDKSYMLGRRASDMRVVQFQDTRVSRQDVVGAVGGAVEVLNRARPNMHVLYAAGTVGLARIAMEHAVQYAKERKTFGKPIAEHQAVAFMLADMAKDIEAGRLLTWQAAVVFDKGEDAAVAASTARSFCQTMAMQVTTDAVQVFGGYGYSKEYPVEKLMRDAKVYQLLDGAAYELNTQVGKKLLLDTSVTARASRA
jgi:acyl-CoA dehydrogenase